MPRGARALLLQFEADDPPGLLGVHLMERGVTVDAVRMDEPHAPLDLDGYDMLITLGGAMGANDGSRFPFLHEATAALGAAVARRMPCLGVCLGGQLLAKTLGAEVSRNRDLELGLTPIALEPAAGHDPLLRGLGPVVQTVQFHQDTFAVPPGGVVLATSARCATQIVRCAERAYALQFHPEVFWQTFASWVEQGYLATSEPAPGRDGAALVDTVRAHESTVHRQARVLLDNFLRLCAG